MISRMRNSISSIAQKLAPVSGDRSREMAQRVAGIALPLLCLNSTVDTCVTVWGCAEGTREAFGKARAAWESKNHGIAIYEGLMASLGGLSAALLCTGRDGKWKEFVSLRLIINAMKVSPMKATAADHWGTTKLSASVWRLNRPCKSSIGVSTGFAIADQALKALGNLEHGFVLEAVSHSIVSVVKGLRGYRSLQKIECTI